MKHYCTHCSTRLAERQFTVHDPHGVSGRFCGAACYEAARESKPVLPVRAQHGDADTLMPVEGIMRHAGP